MYEIECPNCLNKNEYRAEVVKHISRFDIAYMGKYEVSFPERVSCNCGRYFTNKELTDNTIEWVEDAVRENELP